MTGRFPDNRCVFRSLIHPCLVLAVLLAAVLPSLALASAGTTPPETVPLHQSVNIPERNPNPSVRVEDPNGLLTAQQFQVLNAILDRLARLGTESVVFVRDANDEATNRAWLADDLRLAWGVESSFGARDGLVLVVSVDRTDPNQSTLVASSGIDAFPIRQLSAAGFEHMLNEVALPQLQQGDAVGGVRDLLELTLGTVIDRAGVLSERQIVTLDGDLRRLGKLGLPTLVYIRPATDTSAESQALANDLLAQWAVETEEDTSHAMVLVVTTDTANPEDSSIVYAAGPEAFPIRQLTADTYQAILNDQALPAVQNGDVYLGLAYAVRRAINYAEYSPPDPAPLNEPQEWFQEPLNIVAAVLVQVALLLYLLVPAIVDRRLTLIPAPLAMTVYVAITTTLAVLVGVLGVLDRNRAAALTGLAVALAATVILPLMRAGALEIRAWWTERQARPAEASAGLREVSHVD